MGKNKNKKYKKITVIQEKYKKKHKLPNDNSKAISSMSLQSVLIIKHQHFSHNSPNTSQVDVCMHRGGLLPCPNFSIYAQTCLSYSSYSPFFKETQLKAKFQVLSPCLEAHEGKAKTITSQSSTVVSSHDRQKEQRSNSTGFQQPRLAEINTFVYLFL